MRWRQMLLIAAMVCCTAAHAGNLSVMPVVVALSALKPRESVAITNQASHPSTIQADVVSWSQQEGRDVYTRTSDLLVNPEVFTLVPGQTQVLRLGWRGRSPLDTEQTYRILLREVPAATALLSGPAGAAPPARIQVLLELRIPVYVAPQTVEPSLVWQARQVGEGHIDVNLINQGNVHTVVHDLQLSTSSGLRVGQTLGVNAAVLAGQQRSWRLSLPNAGAPDLGVDLRVDHSRHRLSIIR